MAMLSKATFLASRRFIATNARPLEAARFSHAFEGGSGQSVIRELQKFQNPDGGFGNALDPDLRAPESSALCTSIAFQVLRATQTTPDPKFTSSVIVYLLNNLNLEMGHWRIIPTSAELSPHAPWWRQTGRDGVYDGFSLNPTAEILGYLYDHQELVPSRLLARLSDLTTHYVSNSERLEMHDLLCCLCLLKTPSLPSSMRTQLSGKLASLFDSAVTWDPSQWKGYNLRPLQAIDDPESSFLKGRQREVTANLDYEIQTQGDDGSWMPTWSWGNSFPDDWLLAQRECSGVVTLEKLLLLQKFDRIEA